MQRRSNPWRLIAEADRHFEAAVLFVAQTQVRDVDSANRSLFRCDLVAADELVNMKR